MSGIAEVEENDFQPPPPTSSPPPETPREESVLNVEQNDQPLLNFESPKPLEDPETKPEPTPVVEEPKDHIPSEPDMHEVINEDPVEENIMNMNDDDDEETTKKEEKIDMDKHVRKRQPKPQGPTKQQKTWQRVSLFASIALLLASVALAIGGIALIVQPASSWGRNAVSDPDYMPLYQGIPSIIIGCFVLLTAVLAILAAVTIKAQKARLITSIVVCF
jgi:hypothetical protein